MKVGPVPVVFPNSDSRRRALHRHDIHHLLTGYATDLRGEAEISAWELAAGCHRYAAAWGFGLIGAIIGIGIAPLRTLRAFRRGREMRPLYGPVVDLAAVHAMNVDAALAYLQRT